jgi:GxxExxY protein
MLHNKITARIIEAAFEVGNELGVGYLESVYENAFCIALRQKDLQVSRQVPLKVSFRGVIVGDFKADLMINEKIIVEIKVAANLLNEHYAQILNYLKTTGIEVGLVINFGTPKIQYRRFENRFGKERLASDVLRELTSE